jgi:TonB family C-terminal domain
MKSLSKLVSASLLAALLAPAAFAQRPRITQDSKSDQTQTVTTATTPAPASVKAKYEGGFFGYNQKQEGTLSFDDTNNRLLFRNKYQKEMFSIPYDAVFSAFADTQSRRPTAATVIGSAVPYGLGLPALLIKKKHRYLTLQYEDPDTQRSGVTSFKLENKEILNSVVSTLAGKAGLTQRGEGFIRVRPRRDSSSAGVSMTDGSIIRVDDARQPVSAGVLNGRATSLPKPVYPREAREAGAAGSVTVQVIIDEEGNVISAKAVSGHALLQESAVAAARQAKFRPMMIDGQPAKVSGVITYAFELQ